MTENNLTDAVMTDDETVEEINHFLAMDANHGPSGFVKYIHIDYLGIKKRQGKPGKKPYDAIDIQYTELEDQTSRTYDYVPSFVDYGKWLLSILEQGGYFRMVIDKNDQGFWHWTSLDEISEEAAMAIAEKRQRQKRVVEQEPF